MNPVDLKYPVVGLADAQPGRESWELFWDVEFFAKCNRRQVSRRKGMLIVDVEGRCWRISSVRDLGLTGGLGSRIFLFLTGDHRVDQTLDPIPDMTFEDAKAEFPNAEVLSVMVSKGRDFAWQGAVDALRVNDAVFDFEEYGVTATPAP